MRSEPAEPWTDLTPGAPLRIVKLAPSGEAAATYLGTVFDAGASAPWLGVAATWERGVIELGGLRFEPGDQLHEFFSPANWFNVFSIWTPQGELRGWYANVTYPARLDASTTPATLAWQDLYVDVIALPNGSVAVRDEEELGAAAVGAALGTEIACARDELLSRFAARTFPFHEGKD